MFDLVMFRRAIALRSWVRLAAKVLLGKEDLLLTAAL